LQPTRPPPIDRHDQGGVANASCAGKRGGAAPDDVTVGPACAILVKMPAKWWTPMMTTRTSGAPPPAADNENDADAGAVAVLASNARSIQQELVVMSQA